jgi:dihydroflavonol-4-reductase
MILVTGASGLLGSHLIKELVKQGKQIRALYCNTILSENAKGVEWIQGDILDVSSLKEVMRDVDQVYHCAAIVSFHPEQKDVLHHINIEGTANVVNASLHAGVKKLLFVSSVAALGRVRGDTTINEKMNWVEERTNSEYGKSKYLAEMEVWRGIGEGLPAVIVNPVIILGAGDWERGSTEIFKTAYNEFPWYTRGINGFVDVQDVVKAMQLLMNGTPVNERFIICSENVAYKEIFTEIAGYFNKKPPYKEVTPLIAEMVWRWESIKARFTHKVPLLTKETARTAQTKICFDNSKLKFYAPNFEYTPIKESIKRICGELKEKYSL